LVAVRRLTDRAAPEYASPTRSSGALEHQAPVANGRSLTVSLSVSRRVILGICLSLVAAGLAGCTQSSAAPSSSTESVILSLQRASQLSEGATLTTHYRPLAPGSLVSLAYSQSPPQSDLMTRFQSPQPVTQVLSSDRSHSTLCTYPESGSSRCVEGGLGNAAESDLSPAFLHSTIESIRRDIAAGRTVTLSYRNFDGQRSACFQVTGVAPDAGVTCVTSAGLLAMVHQGPTYWYELTNY
jgi:hypothetical protein